jgi:hypothetical protein
MDATLSASSETMLSARARLQRHIAAGLLRMRMQEALSALLISTTLSAWLLAALLLADKLFSLKQLGIPVWTIWGAASLLAVPYILWRVASPRLHDLLAAVNADDRLGLNARLCTALTLDVRDPANAAFGALFFQEAESRLAKLNVAKAFPLRVPRAFALLAIPAALSAAVHYGMDYKDALGLVSEAQGKRRAEEIRTRASQRMEKAIQDLKKEAETGVEQNTGTFKPQMLVEQAQDVHKKLKDGEISPDQALTQLAQIKREIQDQKDDVAHGKEFKDRLESLKAKDLNLENEALSRDLSDALKNGDPNQAAQAARKLGDKIKDTMNDPNLSPEEKQKKLDQMKREMEKLAGALAEDRALKEKLEDVAVESDEYKALQKAVSEFEKKEGEKERKNGDRKAGQDVEQKLEEVAQELERLAEEDDVKLDENGEKQMEKLEQMEAGIDEAMEAVAGAEAGGEELAAEGEKGGEKGGAKAGGKQAGKMGAAKAGGKQGGAKKGGKMAGGKAGQEGGESGKQGGQSGMQDGSKDGKSGDKDSGPSGGGGPGRASGARPLGELADPGFRKEKVKGQIQNGSITSLSHFRGQGAKGTAPNEFKQALEAAEKDPASSLELERVPADARETVRDYFLKVKRDAGIPAPDAGGLESGPATPPAPAPGAEKKGALQE